MSNCTGDRLDYYSLHAFEIKSFLLPLFVFFSRYSISLVQLWGYGLRPTFKRNLEIDGGFQLFGKLCRQGHLYT